MLKQILMILSATALITVAAPAFAGDPGDPGPYDMTNVGPPPACETLVGTMSECQPHDLTVGGGPTFGVATPAPKSKGRSH